MGTPITAPSLGTLLRQWRHRRRLSQFDLACEAEISTGHLSSLETGRVRPTSALLLHLAECLDVPMRDRNALLAAADYAPAFHEGNFDAPEFDPVRRHVEAVLSAHEPNPALAVDRRWVMLAANRPVAHLVAGADPTLLRPPVNMLRLCLHPAGLASRIVNLRQWRAHMIVRLRRQIELAGDTTLMDLVEEVRDYPSPRATSAPDGDIDTIATPFRLATIDGVLSFLGTTTSFSTPIDIALSELAIEAFLPADARTAQVMRGWTDRGSQRDAALASQPLPF